MLKIFKFLIKNGLYTTYIEIKTRIIGILIFHRFDMNINKYASVRGKKKMQIGKNFRAGKHLHIECLERFNGIKFNGKLIIKNNVIVHHFIHIGIANYIEIGNNVLMASKIYISDHNHGYYTGDNQSNPLTPPIDRELTCDKTVVIGDNVWIAEMVTILPGVSIGAYSIIGAGSVVTKSIPSYSIAVGNPAKVVKKYDFNRKQWVKIKGNKLI